MFVAATEREQFLDLVERMRGAGCTPIVLYGAGRVAASLRPAEAGPDVIAIVDDDTGKQGGVWAGLPVVSAPEAVSRGVRSVLITAERPAQDALWARRRVFLDAGARVLCVPARFEGKTWDDCLAEHYEYTVGVEAGLSPAYERDYPAADAKESPWFLGPLLERVVDGAAVCEIGTGNGRWTRHVIGRSGAYYAVDYSARLLFEVMEHRFAAHLDRLHLIHDETASLAGVPDRSVDLVFSIDVFVHFKIDLVHQFLASIRRVLAPSGRALVHFATWGGPAIDVWRAHHTPYHGGGTSLIHYNHPDWLAASAASAGLGFEVVDAVGQNLLCEFRPG